MHKILVPTDFSEHALYAAEVAAKIAKMVDARVYFLHVVNMPTYADNYTMREEYQDVAEGLYVLKMVKKRFKELMQKDFLKDVNVGEVVQFENVYETITSQAAEHDIDLIIMGSHGTSGFKENFIGSNTEKVVRTAECPVLTVKKRYENFQVNDMVFASDFNKEIKQKFSKVKAFADLFEAKMHLLKVITPQEFQKSSTAKKKMVEFADEMGIKNYTTNIYNDDSVENGILDFSEDLEADLVSLETHGRTGISHLIRGSLAEDVVNHSALPVLSQRIKK